MIEIDYIVGADGGGTKTALAVIDADTGKVVRTARVGQINSNFTGAHAAAEQLAKGIKEATSDGRLIAAGVGDPAFDDIHETAGSTEFKRRLDSALGTPVYIRSDAYMALYGLTEGASGALIIAGTGAMGIAEDACGSVYVAGGWGRLTGDEGSGYYIALSGIKAALRYYDRVAPETALLEKVREYFGCDDARRLIDIFYADPYLPPDIAGFSTAVSECAGSGDKVAMGILLRAASYLADYSRTLLNESGSELLGVYGGVLTNDRYVRGEFERITLKRFPSVMIREPEVKPEVAAAKYALKQAYRHERGIL